MVSHKKKSRSRSPQRKHVSRVRRHSKKMRSHRSNHHSRHQRRAPSYSVAIMERSPMSLALPRVAVAAEEPGLLEAIGGGIQNLFGIGNAQQAVAGAGALTFTALLANEKSRKFFMSLPTRAQDAIKALMNSSYYKKLPGFMQLEALEKLAMRLGLRMTPEQRAELLQQATGSVPTASVAAAPSVAPSA